MEADMIRQQKNHNPDANGSGGGGWNRLEGPKVAFRTYRGAIDEGGNQSVWYELAHSTNQLHHPLLPRLELRKHSSTGFAWGYGGSGPAQLALALLADALVDPGEALLKYQQFKRDHVAKWRDEWFITAEEIQQFAARARSSHQSQRFASGQIVATPAALAEVPNGDILLALRRHLCGDWGELDRHDWNANELALVDGSRLLSAFDATNGERFWIITEADRSVTTVLLPGDY